MQQINNNLTKKWGTCGANVCEAYRIRFPPSREGSPIIFRSLFGTPAVDAQSIPSPFGVGLALFLST